MRRHRRRARTRPTPRTSTVDAMRTPANSGSWLSSHAISVPTVTSPPIGARVLRGEFAAQRDHRRHVDERGEQIDGRSPGAWQGCGAKNARATRGWRKRRRLRRAPRTFEPSEQILQRHPVEPDVMRAHPQIDRSFARRPSDPRQISESQRPPAAKRGGQKRCADPQGRARTTDSKTRAAARIRQCAASMPADRRAPRTSRSNVRGRSTSGTRGAVVARRYRLVDTRADVRLAEPPARRRQARRIDGFEPAVAPEPQHRRGRPIAIRRRFVTGAATRGRSARPAPAPGRREVPARSCLRRSSRPEALADRARARQPNADNANRVASERRRMPTVRRHPSGATPQSCRNQRFPDENGRRGGDFGGTPRGATGPNSFHRLIRAGRSLS